VGTPEGKTPLRKPRHRWGNNIKMDLLEIRCGWGACTGLLQLRIGASGELLCTWQQTFGLHTMQEIS
jgi:hypothetical protein